MDGFVSPKKASQVIGVSPQTLRIWAEKGKIEFTRTPSKNKQSKRRYNIQPFLEKQQKKRKKIIYCRVSSHSQKSDLERQIGLLQSQYPTHTLIQDIGSGINFKRKGLKTILELCINQELEEVVVTYKDRLTRFGFEMFQWLFKQSSNAKIVVLNEKDTSPEQELAEDILTITTVFSSKLYGMRRNKKKDKDGTGDDKKGFESQEEDS